MENPPQNPRFAEFQDRDKEKRAAAQWQKEAPAKPLQAFTKMANLRTAMDSSFWDLNLSSPQALGGSAKAVPGESFPLDNTRASRALRIQQISLIGNGFPLGIIPSYAPTSQKELGSFSLQTLFLRAAVSNWLIGLIGQFRPKKLISSIKSEFTANDALEFPSFKNVTKHILDKSLYSIGLSSHVSPHPSTSLLWSTEKHGEKEEKQHRAMVMHKLPNHDITLEAAWPELFMDHKGRYWNVPASISLDLLSVVSDSGFRYRLGLHKNKGQPQPLNSSWDKPPVSLMPGLCAKAAFSYEKKKFFWRIKEKREDLIEKTKKGWVLRPSYDVRLNEPHAAISGIVGGTFGAWLGRGDNLLTIESRGEGDVAKISWKRNPLEADLFSSICYTLQHGKFRKSYGDLTRIDVRLDMCSASAFVKRVFNAFKSSSKGLENSASSPRLNLILQQQVAGPIVFRVDSRVLLDCSSEKQGPHIEDFIYSLNYSFRLLESGKVVAWYSPKRKEGMVELRLFEF